MSKLTKFFLTSFLCFLVLGIFLTVSAQEETSAEIIELINLDENVQAEDLEIAKPTILPDNPLYVFKNWAREIQSFFTLNPVAKAELRKKFSNEKLIEVKEMVEQNKNQEKIEKAVQNYQEEMEKVVSATEKIREKAEESERVGEFLDKFIQNQTLHQRILQKLETQVPAEISKKIEEVREIHIENFGKVMTSLESQENIQERLEKNLQEVKGSEFKEFKNLEVLKELEEKAPEEVKEAVRRVHANVLIQLKEKVEALPAEKIKQFQAYTEIIAGEKEKQMEILEELKGKIEAPTLKKRVIQSKDKILEKIKAQGPGVCITLWDPVCGTDGKTYSNSCFAQLAGIKIAYKGECKEDEQKEQQIQIKEAPKLESKKTE